MPENSLRTIFNGALDRTDEAERANFLEEACRGNSEVRARVDELLRAHEEAEGFFTQPAKTPASGAVSVNAGMPLTEKAGDSIGRYKLLQQIGEGGCGVVYMAEQEEPVRRRVALKVIKLGMDTRQVVARFEAERQALAMMDHSNIARVLDAGATETGRPYFVMELVRGTKITEFCDANKLSARERLELFLPVGQAVQHAHQKGIIHRDLKPSNILVTMIDGKAVPKVIDFGIAKATSNQRLTDKTVFTAFEQFIGTPAYMSPEQAEMSGVDIDTRTDIYSLGVVLYELLTGKTPFDSEALVHSGLDEIRRTIRETDPPKPSTRLHELTDEDRTTVAQARRTDGPRLIHQVRGDLDWVVMKCLEKDRALRYETANGLARDIERHLHNEPVTARPPSRVYIFQKLLRRHKVAFSAAGAVAATLLLGIMASTWLAIRAKRAEREQISLREQAQSNEKKAEIEATKSRQVATFLKEMLKGVGPSVALGRDTVLLREILESIKARLTTDLHDQPEVEAELRHTLGDVFYALGDYSRAEEMYREALAMREKLWGKKNFEVTQSMNGLALALWKGGKPGEAEEILRESLETRWKLFGGEGAEVARSLYELAEVIRYEGKIEEAEKKHREALATRRKLNGGETLEVADSLNRLGSLLSGKQSNEDEGLLRESLAIRKKLLGGEHPDVAEALDNLAHSLTRQGKLEESEPMHRQALEMRRKYYGNAHAEVALSLVNMGTVLEKQEKLTEAEELFRQAWGMRDTLRGYDNGSNVFERLCNMLKRQQRWEDVETLQRELLASEKKRFGEEHHEVAGSLINIGLTLKAQGRFVEAEATLRTALAMHRKVSGEESGNVAITLHNLALVLGKAGKLIEAETAFKEAIAIFKKVQGEESGQLALSLNEYSYVLRDQGKLREAEIVSRQALEMRKKVLGSERPETAKSFNTLGVMLADQNKLIEAESSYREAVGILRKNSDGLTIGAVLANLGYVLYRQSRLAEAEAAYKDSLAHLRKFPGYNNSLALMVCDQLTSLIRKRGNKQEANAIRQEELALRRKLERGETLAGSLATFASELLNDGEFVKAEPLIRECLAIREKEMPDDWMTFNARSMLGDSLFRQKKYGEAESLLITGFEGLESRAGKIPENFRTLRRKEAVLRLKEFYEKTGRAGEFGRYREKLAEINATDEASAREVLLKARAQAPAHDPQVAVALAKLFLILVEEEKFDEAEPLARECLAIREQKLPDNWLTHATRSALGGILLKQQKYAEAEPLLLSAYANINRPNTEIPLGFENLPKQTLERLVQLYESRGQTNAVVEWRQKLTNLEK